MDMTTEHAKTVPVDTGKVKIGIYYQPDQRPQLTADGELLQTALLLPANRSANPMRRLMQLLLGI